MTKEFIDAYSGLRMKINLNKVIRYRESKYNNGVNEIDTVEVVVLNDYSVIEITYDEFDKIMSAVMGGIWMGQADVAGPGPGRIE